jgi:cyclopropane fatty-acyl-phospholipid synthase-like methyltransferase
MTTDAIIKTREVYNSSPIVAHYARATELQPAERKIFSLLAAELPQMQILDIGVGGGRTTRHLASAAQRYVGDSLLPATKEYVRALALPGYVASRLRNLRHKRHDAID